MENAYEWVPFYEALADRLLTYSNKRSELFELIKEVTSEQPLMKYLHFEREEWWGPRNHQIDPFSVIGIINRGITDSNRTSLAKVLSGIFDMQLPAPKQFAGIPVMDNRKSFFAGSDEIWDLFVLAMEVAKTNIFSDEFKIAFEKAIAINGNGLAYVSMGLYWMRPNVFIPLDGNTRAYVSSHYEITPPSGSCTGDDYVKFLESLNKKLAKQDPVISFPVLSYTAWIEKGSGATTESKERVASMENVTQITASASGVQSSDCAKNTILYGAPGTGKTYSTVFYTVSIIEEKKLDKIVAEGFESVFRRYQKYKEDGLVAFTTFHQSFGYEEFIEGIRPIVSSEENAEAGREIEYVVHDGIFKSFCDKAGTPIASNRSEDFGIGKNPSVWKVSLEGTGSNPTRTECMDNNHIRIGWEAYGETISDATDYSNDGGRIVLNTFYNRMQIGDIVMSCYSSKTIDAIGVITGEPEWHEEYPILRRLRKVKWLVKGINEDIMDLNAGKVMTLASVYKLSVSVSDTLQLLKKLNPNLFAHNIKIPNRVFIIDEINRGNISKIFGELITLLEPLKRVGAKEELRATLPYSGQNFGVPNNIYLIGTMNTADRSIALIDTALRRRFEFVEVLPNPAILHDVLVDGVDISQMLETLNKRITVLLDREHVIGHSYMMVLKSSPSIETLAGVFKKTIIPLLQEYFYDDYNKIQLVLGDNQKSDESTRFFVARNDARRLFGVQGYDLPEYYEINEAAFNRIDAYAFMQ